MRDNRPIPRVIVVFLACCFVALCADDPGATEENLLEHARRLKERLNREEERIRGELEPVRREVAELARRTDELEKERNRVAAERETLGQELDLLLDHLRTNRERIRRRAITLYRRTDLALLEQTFRLEDPVAFVDQLAFSLKMIEADKRFFREMTGRIRDVSALREEKRQRDDELTRLEEELSREREKFGREQARLERILADLHRAGKALEKELADFQEGRRQLEEKVGEIRQHPQAATDQSLQVPAPAKEPVGAGGGASVDLAWPLAGNARQVLSFFGRQKDPGLDLEFNNPGIDIRAEAGAPVLAALAGTVRYRGSMKGMGQVVMLESPRGVVTLYSMLGEIEVGLGQKLEVGEVLGRIGPAPARDKPAYLHFEVRKNGSPVDPMDYF